MSSSSLLLLSVLTLAAAGAAAAPACRYVSPDCDTLTRQMQVIHAPRPDNNFGRVEDFYRIDHNRWLQAEAPRFRPLRTDKPIRKGQDLEAEYKRGQAYVSLTERDKWMVLRARDPEDFIWRRTSRAIRKQVERESEFFQRLRTGLIKSAYMTMTPAQRNNAATLDDAAEAEAFILANAGAFLVTAYQVDLNDILEHLKPVTAKPLLFPSNY